jgi:hypothetical protein
MLEKVYYLLFIACNKHDHNDKYSSSISIMIMP